MKTGKFFSFCAFLLACLSGCTPGDLSDAQKESFIKFYGSYQFDVGHDVLVLPDDAGYALTGTATKIDSVQRMVLIITDIFGNYSGEAHFFGGDIASAGNALAVTNDGFILAGSVSDTLANGNVQKDAFIVKTDREGEEVWSRAYGSSLNEELYDILPVAGGGYLAAGYKYQGGQKDLWVFLTDPNGNLLYQLTGENQNNDDEAVSLLEVPGGFLCACTYDDGLLNGLDMVVLLLNSSCITIDTKAFGTAADDVARCLVKADDSYYLLGYTENTTAETQIYSFDLDNGSISEGVKFATISVPGIDHTGEKMVLTAGGGLAVTGTITNAENKDIFLQLYPKGSDAARFYFGETGNQTGNGIAATPDGGVIITGGNNYEGNSMITLIKTKESGQL